MKLSPDQHQWQPRKLQCGKLYYCSHVFSLPNSVKDSTFPIHWCWVCHMMCLVKEYEPLKFTSHVNTLFQRQVLPVILFFFPLCNKNVLKKCPSFCLDLGMRKHEEADPEQLTQTCKVREKLWFVFVMCCVVEIVTSGKLTNNRNCYKK